jgi:hypothetical protein
MDFHLCFIFFHNSYSTTGKQINTAVKSYGIIKSDSLSTDGKICKYKKYPLSDRQMKYQKTAARKGHIKNFINYRD